jgi:alkaline phosphatase
MTASLNSIVTDSAPGAACYSTGNKSNNNQQGVFPDDTTDNGDNPRQELIGEFLARTQGKSLGIVATSDVFDATPGSFGSHTQARGAGMGICDNYLDEMVPKANLAVLLGGGRKWFLPNTTVGTARTGAANDYAMSADIVNGWGLPTAGVVGDIGRDLLTDFQTAGFTYAPDKTTLTAVAGAATKLLGLFSYSNMNIALDKIDGRRGTISPTLGTTVVAGFGFPDQPMLDEMTDAALTVLNKNTNGFVLMVEAASIDKQAHNMDTERWILDMIEFDKAVQKARQFQTLNPDTLLVVTADHECAGVAIIGGSLVSNANLITRSTSGLGTAAGGPRNGVVGTYESAGFPAYTISGIDGYPTTTDVNNRMLLGYAANADRYENWLTNELPLRDSQQPTAGTAYGAIVGSLPNGPLNRDVAGNYLVTGQVQDGVAAHTGGDIPLSAQGRGAKLFNGYMDNTEVYFKIMQAVIGGATN